MPFGHGHGLHFAGSAGSAGGAVDVLLLLQGGGLLLLQGGGLLLL